MEIGYTPRRAVSWHLHYLMAMVSQECSFNLMDYRFHFPRPYLIVSSRAPSQQSRRKTATAPASRPRGSMNSSTRTHQLNTWNAMRVKHRSIQTRLFECDMFIVYSKAYFENPFAWFLNKSVSENRIERIFCLDICSDSRVSLSEDPCLPTDPRHCDDV